MKIRVAPDCAREEAVSVTEGGTVDKTFTFGRLRVTFGPAAPPDQRFVWVNTPMLTGRLRAFATKNVTVALWPRKTREVVRAAFVDAHKQYVAMAT